MNPQKTRSNLQETMFLIIEEYLASSRTQKQICNDYGLSLSKFFYWLRKYKQESSYSNSFIPVKVKDANAPIRIELPGGVNIILNGDAEYISRLIYNLVERHASA